MNLRFYQCDICGKVIAILSDTGVPTICCGQPMRELAPNMTDGAFEKHVPVFFRDGNTVQIRVGSAPHPMTEEHRINWIGLKTDRGFMFRELNVSDIPRTQFHLDTEDHIDSVYSFCNIHGLWGSGKPFGI